MSENDQNNNANQTLDKLKVLEKQCSVDNFLFFFKPKNIDKQCIFGISLITAVKVISLLLVIKAVFDLLSGFQEKYLFWLVFYIFCCVFFLIISLFAFLSTIKHNYEYANISYVAYSILFIIHSLCFIVVFVIAIICFVNPFSRWFFRLRPLWGALTDGLWLMVKCYFIWILYCFKFTLKPENNDDIVKREDNINTNLMQESNLLNNKEDDEENN